MFGILAFGDSIVFGRGNNIDRGWTGRLRKYFETKDYYNALYNLGVPGANSNHLLERFETECKARTDSKRPDDKRIILIGIGMNDIRYKKIPDEAETPIAVFKKNILKLIKIAKKYTDKIVFIGITPVDETLTKPYEGLFYTNEQIKKYNRLISSCCKDNQVLFIDLFSELENQKEIFDDGIHLNAKGYEKMYEIIKKFLIDNKLID